MMRMLNGRADRCVAAWVAVLAAAGALAAMACGAAPSAPTSAAAESGAVAARAAVGAGVSSASAAAAQPNLTPADFMDRGWTCRNPPVPGRVSCSPPNQGFPAVPPPADRPASYTLKVWQGAGCSLSNLAACSYAGNLILLRPDVYNGQKCESTADPFIWLPVIGYYECLHTTGS